MNTHRRRTGFFFLKKKVGEQVEIGFSNNYLNKKENTLQMYVHILGCIYSTMYLWINTYKRFNAVVLQDDGRWED